MANSPTVGVFIPGTGYLNTSTSTSPTGAADPMDGSPIPTGLTVGKMIEIGSPLAAQLTAPNTVAGNQLYGGAYQWVQVDSAATAAEVAPNLAAYIKFPAATAAVTDAIAVTGYTGATSTNMPAGVFISTIAPGAYGFIFVGAGRVNVKFANPITIGGAAAIGNTVAVGSAAGAFDAVSATATTAATVGVTTAVPVAGAVSAIYMDNIMYRIPAV